MTFQSTHVTDTYIWKVFPYTYTPCLHRWLPLLLYLWPRPFSCPVLGIGPCLATCVVSWFQVVCVPLFLACPNRTVSASAPWRRIPVEFTASLAPGPRPHRGYHNGGQERQPQFGEPAMCLARAGPRASFHQQLWKNTSVLCGSVPHETFLPLCDAAHDSCEVP